MTGLAVPPGADGADLIAGYIAAWQPSSVPPPAASFARSVAARAGPGTRARANALLRAAARLAAVGIPLGLQAAPPRERAKAPCSPAEIGGYLALADAQPTLSRRMRASGLVCLGAGAGLIGADLRAVRGTDVACRSGGVVVEVHGARPRAVPVLARYHQRLLASAEFAGSGLVTGGASAVRKNITTPLTRSLAGGAGLPRLEASRLRMTWLADCAPLPARPPRSCTPPGSPAPSGWATCSPPSSPPMRQPRSRCWEPGGEHPAGPDQGDHRRFRRRAAARGAAAPLGG